MLHMPKYPGSVARWCNNLHGFMMSLALKQARAPRCVRPLLTNAELYLATSCCGGLSCMESSSSSSRTVSWCPHRSHNEMSNCLPNTRTQANMHFTCHRMAWLNFVAVSS
eukprot:3366139-Amphidinium_carterae.1